MRRAVRHVRALCSVSCMTVAGLLSLAASASAQTFTVRVNGGTPSYGRGTVTSSPAGINCTFLGKENELVGTGTCSASFAAGFHVELSVATTDGTTHTGWTGDCAAFTSTCTLLVDQNRSTIVILKPALHRVTVVGAGNGTGAMVETVNFSASPRIDCLMTRGVTSFQCASDYPFGSKVTLEVRIPNSGTSGNSRFVGYSVPPCANASLCQAVVTEPMTITGTWLVPELHIRGAGTGSGRVVGVGMTSGLDCMVAPSGNTGTCDRVSDLTNNTTLTFTATPNEGSVFVGGSGLCSGTGPCSTMGQEPPNMDLIARFEAQPTGIVSLFLNGTGGYGRGRVTSSPPGIDCDFSNPLSTDGTGTCRADFAVGTTVQLTATPRDGTTPSFAGDCASTSATCTVGMYHDRRVTVQLDPASFPITIVASGNGSGSVDDFANPVGPNLRCSVTRGVAGSGCVTTYPFGAPLRFSPNANGSSKVTVTETACVSAPCTVTGPITLTTTFTAPEINVTGAGSGSGRVVDTAVSGIDCTITPGGLSGSCSKVFDMTQATKANFNPLPATGSVFAGYSGLCSGIQACSTSGDFPPNGQLVARFDLAGASPQLLTVNGAGNGSGVIQSGPAGILCTVTAGVAGSGCSASFASGTMVTLAAGPTGTSQFVGWEGACNSTSMTCTINMAQAQSVTARFEINPTAVQLTILGAGTGNGLVTIVPGNIQCPISGGGIVDGASCVVVAAQPLQVTLTATPQFGSSFGRWEGDECANSTELTCTFTLSANRTVAANFISPHSPHDLTLVLSGASKLTPDESAQLDRLGNMNGTFDLGDLLAFLDRTGQKLTPTDAAAVMAIPQRPTSASPKTRRVP